MRDDEMDAGAGSGSGSGSGTGSGTGEARQCDKMDIVFVVDNSGSMDEEQTNLGANFPMFASLLESYTVNNGMPLDFRVAITTTGRTLDYSIDLGGGFGTFPMHEDGENGAFQNNCNVNKRWLEKTDPNMAQALACRANVGTTGPSIEMPLLMSKWALADALATGTGLERDNVVVHERVDQWAILEQADAFVTHHGLNSTHEGIFMGVPMLSYPFFWDQPSLAARCAELGLALRLAPTLRGPPDPGGIRRALHDIQERAPAMRLRLAAAREWELEVMAGRPTVIRQIMDLA